MQYANRAIARVVETYCKQNGFDVEFGLDGWLMVMSKGVIKHYIYGYDVGLNSSVVHRIANDKSATAEILASCGIDCVPHALFMNHNQFKYVPLGGHWTRMLQMQGEHPEGLVLKPNEGTCGNLVFKVATELELEQAATAIFAVNQNLAVAPYLDIDREIRVILLDQHPLVVYEKQRPSVIGDGVRSAFELVLDRVPAQLLATTLSNLPPNRTLLDAVLPEGETFFLNWRHNLDLGAEPELLHDGPHWRASVDIAGRAAQAIGLAFGAIDVVWSKQTPRILEINSGVMIESLSKRHPDLAQRVYTQALDKIVQRLTR